MCIWYGVDNIRDYKRSTGAYHWIDNRQYMVCSYIQYDDDSYKASQEYAASLYGDYGVSQQNTRININTAAKEQLVTLPGIGTSRAEDIISYRSKNGSFKSIEDIKNVPGIKDGAFAKIKDYICV